MPDIASSQNQIGTLTNGLIEARIAYGRPQRTNSDCGMRRYSVGGAGTVDCFGVCVCVGLCKWTKLICFQCIETGYAVASDRMSLAISWCRCSRFIHWNKQCVLAAEMAFSSSRSGSAAASGGSTFSMARVSTELLRKRSQTTTTTMSFTLGHRRPNNRMPTKVRCFAVVSGPRRTHRTQPQFHAAAAARTVYGTRLCSVVHPPIPVGRVHCSPSASACRPMRS